MHGHRPDRGSSCSELGRLTKRLWLAFDGDAAGAAATLRGMEIADRQGFDVKVVALPPGIDPADDPAGFQGRLAAALPYEVHRVQVEARSTDDREAARRAVTAFLDARPDSLNRRAAWNWANDHFGMPIQIRGGGTWTAKEAPSPRHRRRRRQDRARGARRRDRPPRAPPVARRDPRRPVPQRAAPRAPRSPRGRPRPRRPETLALLAELDYWAQEEEGIDKPTAEIYLLRMTEREAQTELQHAELERVPALSAALVRIRDTIAGLERQTAAPE